MRNPRMLLLLIPVALLAMFGFILTKPNEPSYEGKSLTYWIGRLADTNSPKGLAPKSEQESVRQAIQHMGTNAIILLGDWATRDFPVRRRILNTIPRPMRRFKVLQPEYLDRPTNLRGVSAGQALILLGPEASPTFPQLGHTLTDGEFFGVATRALWILREIGEPAVPTLVAAMTNKPTRMRFVIAMNLGTMGGKAIGAVPALNSLLGDPEPGLQAQCVRSIETITGKPFTNSTPAATAY